MSALFPRLPTNQFGAAHVRTQRILVPAGRTQRLANFVIDTTAHFALAVAIGILVVLIWGEPGAHFLENVPDVLLGILVQVTYYLVLEGTTSRTFGKLITGTRVVSERSGKPTLGQIVIRTLARLIPLDAFSFIDSAGRGWHDRLPRTYVVEIQKRPSPPLRV